ncbi:lipoprotein N-acyltransferase Lnb domain-containing protein [Geomonas sp. Red276]
MDPRRVSSIHLVFAGKSGSLASRFGHVALRLVVCPEGKSTAADCDANLFEHLVLGYEAHVNDLALDTLKALKGDYRAYLFAHPFMDVYRGYAIDEFREVYSLPLRLDDARRAEMVRELSGVHWSFAGGYNFFTRNCATLLQNALRATWPEFASNSAMSGGFLRPDTLFEAMKGTALTDGAALNSLEAAEREGFYFSSTEDFYRKALFEVRGQMKSPQFNDLESYLSIAPGVRRAVWTEDPSYSARLAGDRHLREAQLMLEEYALFRSDRLLLVEAAKYLEEQDFARRADSIRSQLDNAHAKVFDECLLAPIREHAHPLKRSNGIPSKKELPAGAGHDQGCQTVEARRMLFEALTAVKDATSDQWHRLLNLSRYITDTVANIQSLK